MNQIVAAEFKIGSKAKGPKPRGGTCAGTITEIKEVDGVQMYFLKARCFSSWFTKEQLQTY